MDNKLKKSAAEHKNNPQISTNKFWLPLRILLTLELCGAASLIAITLWHALNLNRSAHQEITSDLYALVFLALAAATWIAVTLVAALKKHRSARALAVTLHVCVFALSLGAVQGLLPLYWALILTPAAIIGTVWAVKATPRSSGV